MTLPTPPGLAAARAAAAAEQRPPAPVPWIRVGRGDLAAARHGLSLHERDALAALTAEALIVGGPLGGGDDVWSEIAETGQRWPSIRQKLERRGRIRIVVPDPSHPESAFLHVTWVDERLAEASRSSEQARTAGRTGGRPRLTP